MHLIKIISEQLKKQKRINNNIFIWSTTFTFSEHVFNQKNNVILKCRDITEKLIDISNKTSNERKLTRFF